MPKKIESQTTTWIAALLALLLGGSIGIGGTLHGVEEGKNIFLAQEREKTSGIIVKLDGSGVIVWNGLDLWGHDSDDGISFNGASFTSSTAFLDYTRIYAAKRLMRNKP